MAEHSGSFAEKHYISLGNIPSFALKKAEFGHFPGGLVNR